MSKKITTHLQYLSIPRTRSTCVTLVEHKEHTSFFHPSFRISTGMSTPFKSHLLLFCVSAEASTKATGKTENGTASVSSAAASGSTGASGPRDSRVSKSEKTKTRSDKNLELHSYAKLNFSQSYYLKMWQDFSKQIKFFNFQEVL